MLSLPQWPTLFYSFEWPEHEKYAQELKQVCHDLESQSNISNISNAAKHNLYESAFNFLEHKNTAVEEWGRWAKDCIFKSSANANKNYWPPGITLQVELHESWCHITRDGGYHDVHIHPGSSWSCIYYLDTGDMTPDSKNGVNRFYNPVTPMYTDAGTVYTNSATNFDVNGKNGMLFVFPSWIMHSAMSYTGANNRYVLSANSRITVAK
jgi:uncharacterized protein (TIGR02466 family)